MLINVNDKSMPESLYRYLFIGGLHRSGTSLIARIARELEGAGGITDAPVPENEGCYLQGAIPHDATSGTPMEFATDPNQHMTEAHFLNTLQTRERIEADWNRWFAPNLRWRIEKSPVNMTRMRLLQQLFPLSQFILVIRHPSCVAAAIAKWTDRPAAELIDHWIAAHQLFDKDAKHLHNLMVIRYEDVVERPQSVRSAIAAFLDLKLTLKSAEGIYNGNLDYPQIPRLSCEQESAVRRWGYGGNGETNLNWRFPIQHMLKDIRQNARSAMEMRC